MFDTGEKHRAVTASFKLAFPLPILWNFITTEKYSTVIWTEGGNFKQRGKKKKKGLPLTCVLQWFMLVYTASSHLGSS